MPPPERVFLDWSLPTAPAAAGWLRAHSRDLGSTLAVVPTRQSARRLRAEFSDEAPRIITPADFLPPAGEDIAHPVEAVLALTAFLATSAAARFTALFPAGVPARSFPERLALARRIRQLQGELAENDLTVAEAAERMAAGSVEGARWRDLARLVRRADDELERAGRRERNAAWVESCHRASLPAGIRSVVVVAAADLPPIVAHALERLSPSTHVLIPAPPDPDGFDPWGRPLASAWNERDPGWSDLDAQVDFVSRPDAEGEVLVDSPDLEIALLDRELLPGLSEAVAQIGRTLHDPTGQPLADHWLARSLRALVALDEDPSFDQAGALLRNGAVRAWLERRIPDFDGEAALASFDAVRRGHFPATARAAQPWVRRHPHLAGALAEFGRLAQSFRRDPFATAKDAADEIAAAFSPSLDPEKISRLAMAQKPIAEILHLLRSAADHTPLPAEDWLRSLAEAFAEERIYPARPPRAVEAGGWLELPWSDASTVLIAGMNLGKVPVPLGGEIFLGAGTRQTLGLPGAEARQARDAYFLARTLARTRRVRALVVQLDAQGSPLQPSPLLFAGAGESLPARVERLFSEPRDPRPDPAWSPGWRLDPPVKEIPRAIAVTDFERYLDCPFTFYLGRVVRMQPFEPIAEELDAAQFGELVHYALEHWSLDEAAARAGDAEVIARCLDAHVSAWARETVGRSLSLPLRVQLDSARARLRAFATWQAEDHRAGWRIRRVEVPFDEVLGGPWMLAGWKISGRIDRIDENESTGEWRVVDYKTFDAPDDPARKHLRAFRSDDRTWPPGYARVPDSAHWWTNLQLPLYRQLLIESGRPAESIHCGYFNFPKTVSESGLRLWDTLDDALQASALACAHGVLSDLERRKFWPPNPRAAHPDFAGFFPPGPERVVDPEGAFVRSCAP